MATAIAVFGTVPYSWAEDTGQDNGTGEWGGKVAAWKLGKDGDSRGMRLRLSTDRKDYLPGEEIGYTLVYVNEGKKAVSLARPRYRDQWSHLMSFVKIGQKWLERNPGGHTSGDSVITLRPRATLSMQGVLQHDVILRDYDGRHADEAGPPAQRYEFFVRYRDKFSPKREVARSNTVIFTIRPANMVELRSVYVAMKLVEKEGERRKTILDERRRFRLLRSKRGDELFYSMENFGIVRLGRLADRDDVSLLLDGTDNIHALWKKDRKTYVHAVFKGGFPTTHEMKEIRAKRARLSETKGRRVEIEVIDK